MIYLWAVRKGRGSACTVYHSWCADVRSFPDERRALAYIRAALVTV